MRTYRTHALGAAVLVLVISACQPGGGEASPGAESPGGSPAAELPTITIGSAGFYESQLMAEIYAQALEAEGYTVERNLGIGTREQTYPALTSAAIDLMPEYIGSLLTFTGGTASGDPEETYRMLLDAIEGDDLTALSYTPAQDQNAFVVRPDTAEQFG
ncbi:MAG TPA: glycine betaine ABC transporter substrate-binding protein, partial [Egibacteraceae bacterium]|nr:glycine betaine ABC transporter substrate-binding protein [Egibacteraceae bacterium]